MKVAIIGTGVSGLVAAYRLRDTADVTLYEASTYVGGHTNTVHLNRPDGDFDIDTGFIVYNRRTYPQFDALLAELGVETQETRMGFSVRDDEHDLEYSGEAPGRFFAQRSNLVRGRIYALLRDMVRFNFQSAAFLQSGDKTTTLQDYLRANRFSESFVKHFIIPMGGAIWSSDTDDVGRFPAYFFIRFFKNHGFLDLQNRVVWRTVKGGSHEYVRRICQHLEGRIRINTPVTSIQRNCNGVRITSEGDEETYDHVVLACHSDQALRLLADPTDRERQVLGAIPYQENIAILHTDESVLPKRRRAWSCWNFHMDNSRYGKPCVSYNMNKLQSLASRETFVVTLNSEDIDPAKIIKRIQYTHPLFTPEAVRAQRKFHLINDIANTSYCGAYWGYGFHEDGVVSALRVCQELGRKSYAA